MQRCLKKCPCYNVLIIFSFRHFLEHVKWMKSWTRLFKVCHQLSGFLNKSIRVYPVKAENWHALSQEQYFSKHHFLDICQCAFNNFLLLSYSSLLVLFILGSIFKVKSSFWFSDLIMSWICCWCKDMTDNLLIF